RHPRAPSARAACSGAENQRPSHAPDVNKRSPEFRGDCWAHCRLFCERYWVARSICSITGFHNFRSLPIKSASCCGDIARVERLKSWNLWRTSGRASTACRSSLIFLTMEAVVPGGATRTNHPDAANPGTVSDTVGRFGRDARRSVEATASNLNCPLASGPPRPSMRTDTRPLSTSLMACGEIAKMFGLHVPDKLVALADEVIE